MRVVIDTNVLISGLLFEGGPPALLVDAWIAGKFEVMVSPELIEEYLTVLLRPKFGAIGTIGERRSRLRELLELGNVVAVSSKEHIDAVPADPSDNAVFECAVAGHTRYVISGDFHLVSIAVFRNIQIASTSKAVELLGLR